MKYYTITDKITKVLLAHPWEWNQETAKRRIDFLWDEFARQVPDARAWVNDLAKTENYEPSELQCSNAVAAALRERGLGNWLIVPALKPQQPAASRDTAFTPPARR